MTDYKIAKLVKAHSGYKCEVCDKYKTGKMYEYQNESFIGGYVPTYFKKMCSDCIYRTVYVTNVWKKMKKEGTLDK